jgi:long-chain acyl-CoA synthetase
MANRPYPLYPTEEILDLRQLVDRAAAKYGNKPLLSWFQGEETLLIKTYQDFLDDINALGTALAERGYKGHHIAVLGANSYAWLVVFLAVVNGNNVVVPLDKGLSAPELRHILADAGCTILFHDHGHEALVRQLRPVLPDLACTVSLDGTAGDESSLEQYLTRGRLLLGGGDTTFTGLRTDRDTMAMLMYTSGTTGVSKGVMLSHRNVAASIVGSCKTIWFPGDTVAVLPFHHVLGFFSVFLAIQSGLRVHLNLDLWDLSRDMELARPRIMALVPLFVERLHKKIWDRAEEKGRAGQLRFLLHLSRLLCRLGIDLRRVFFRQVLKAFGGDIQVIFCGGAPMDPAYERAMRDFGITFVFGWGITECSPGVSSNRAHWYRLRSVGHPFPGTEVAVLNPDKNGEGELAVRGDNVMLGYYKNPEATAGALVDGWFHSGDCGRIDRDGFIFLTGRLKNVIILSNGKNVYPEEIEMALQSQIKGIAEVVVREAGRKIVAEIYPDSEHMEKERISDAEAHFRRHVAEVNKTLADHKRIGGVVIRQTEFEKTTTKKIKRHAVVLK